MMTESKKPLHIVVPCVFVISLGFFFSMSDLKIGSFNINGARSDVKGASLFKLMEIKNLDVILFFKKLTVSVRMNMTGRRSGFILSLKTFNSGGVAVLFSQGFTPFSFKVEEIMCGHTLI